MLLYTQEHKPENINMGNLQIYDKYINDIDKMRIVLQ